VLPLGSIYQVHPRGRQRHRGGRHRRAGWRVGRGRAGAHL
jgi:hypothetical protein